MYKYILETAGNINWMALFALVTFFLVFMISLYMVFIKGKDYSKRMAHLPLEQTDSGINTTHN